MCRKELDMGMMPVTNRKFHRGALLVSFALPLTIYALTACRTVYWGDTGEFLVAAISLGIPHSPGTPLYPLLGRCFSLFPAASPSLWVNVMSGFFASVSSVFVYLIVLEISLLRQATRWYGAIVGGLAASLVWAFTHSLWSYSTVAEVYTLQMAFVCGLMYMGVKLRLEENCLNILPLFFFAYGLSLTNNITVLLLAFAFAVLVWRPFSRAEPRHKVFLFLLFLLGLSPYLYMPLRSLHNPAVDWGNPETLGQFIWVLTAREFARNMLGLKYAVTGGFLRASFVYLRLLLSDMSIAGLVLSLFGAGVCFFTSRKILLFFALVYVINITYSFAFGADLELEAYLLPSLLVLVLLLGLGSAAVASSGKKELAPLMSCVLLILPVGMLISRYAERNLKVNTYAENIGENLISSIEEGGIFFTENTVDLFVALYVQSIRGLRQDVSLIYLPYLSHDWYRREVREKFGLDVGGWPGGLIQVMMERGAYYTPLSKIGISPGLLIPDGIRFRAASCSLTDDLISLSRSRMADVDFDGGTEDYDTRRHFAIIHSYLGEYYFLRGRTEASAQEYSRAAEIMPLNPEIQLNLAFALERLGRLDDAFSAYRSSLSLGGDRLRVLKGLGRISLRQGNGPGARDYLCKAASLDTTDPVVFYNLGLANLKLGDFEAAADANLRAIELNPAFPEALVNLGISYLNLRQSAKAESLFRRAIAADSSYVEGYLNLAQVYASTDNLHSALSVLETGLRNAPDSAGAGLIQRQMARFQGCGAN
ncbi:MAG: protein O-mannosyl-transferase family [bacterium]